MSGAVTLVTAAGGRTGRAVVDALLRRGVIVRGLVRRAEQADALASRGAQGVIGDFQDVGSLASALSGCERVIHIGPPMHADEVAITARMLEGAARQGVRHFIYYSVMHPQRQAVFHHRQKLLAEADVIGSGLPYTILQPIRYMQHLEPLWRSVVDDGLHAMPFNTSVRFNVVDLLDVAEAVAVVATKDVSAHAYASYELAGPEALSQDEMASILTEELRRPVVARPVPPEETRRAAEARGLTNERIEHMLGMNAHYDRHGFLGNANVLRWLIARAPTTYRAYVRRLLSRNGADRQT